MNTFLNHITNGIKTVIDWVSVTFKGLLEIGAGLPSEWKAIGIAFTIISIITAIFTGKKNK